jgi:hypothetical protein
MNNAKPFVLTLACAALLTACGGEAPAPTAATQSTPTGAAIQGMGEVVSQAAKGNPIPRDNVPDFVETMEGGRYMTGTQFSNDLRSGGLIMYAVEQDRAAVVAFYKASFEKQGFKITEESEGPVDGSLQSKLEATSDAGGKLKITAIEKPDSVIVNVNYTTEAKK